MVTSLQDVAIIVPRSVVVAPQQTRSPTLRTRDWSPVTAFFLCRNSSGCPNASECVSEQFIEVGHHQLPNSPTIRTFAQEISRSEPLQLRSVRLSSHGDGAA